LESIVPFAAPPSTLHVPPGVDALISSASPSRTDVCCGVTLRDDVEEPVPDAEELDDPVALVALKYGPEQPLSERATIVAARKM